MVKPALPYLDIIADAAQITQDHPLACYQVSGEFAMIHAGAAAGVYALRTMAFEAVDSMIRAGGLYCSPFFTFRPLTSLCTPGASLILTYFTPEFLEWLDEA
jgi:porphobilinogen synthase